MLFTKQYFKPREMTLTPTPTCKKDKITKGAARPACPLLLKPKIMVVEPKILTKFPDKSLQKALGYPKTPVRRP